MTAAKRYCSSINSRFASAPPTRGERRCRSHYPRRAAVADPGVQALLFALFESLALLAQSQSAQLPVEFYSSLPYAITLLALVLTAGTQSSPRALGRPLKI